MGLSSAGANSRTHWLTAAREARVWFGQNAQAAVTNFDARRNKEISRGGTRASSGVQKDFLPPAPLKPEEMIPSWAAFSSHCCSCLPGAPGTSYQLETRCCTRKCRRIRSGQMLWDLFRQLEEAKKLDRRFPAMFAGGRLILRQYVPACSPRRDQAGLQLCNGRLT